MTYRDIEASRNARLWLTQVVLPAATLAVTTLVAFPSTRQAIGDRATRIKKAIQNKLRKGTHKSKDIVITIDARNKAEALGTMEMLAKEIFSITNENKPIHKVVRIKR